MNLLILSRGPELYSTKRLVESAINRGHKVSVVDHSLCNLVLETGRHGIYYGQQRLENIDGIIPRIGSSITDVGAAVIRQFEAKQIYSLISSTALLRSRNKLRAIQVLTGSNINIPKTAFIRYLNEVPYIVEKLGGIPVIIKLLESTHGVGVILADNMQTIQSVLETMRKLGQGVLLQKFIKESSGEDVRAFVVGNEVVASMLRSAQKGEFRSNIHRGASAVRTEISSEELDMVKRSVRALKLEVAGVDFLRSNEGPLILEVNPSPGMEGIENATGIDVGSKIISHMETKIKKFKSVRYFKHKNNLGRKN